MYQVDEKDRVIPLEGLPQSSVGAPEPVVIGDEHKTFVAYYVEDSEDDEDIAIVTFHHCWAYFCGPPNDEAFEGHPLAERGLEPYGSYEVVDSSWIRILERMNSVHDRHDPKRFSDLRHFILTFHDSVFECVAESFDVEVVRMSIREAASRMVAAL